MKEGVVLDTSVETLGVDLRTRTKKLGMKGKARSKKCDVRLLFINRYRVFQKNYMRIGVACRKTQIQEAHGSGSGQERNSLTFTFHGRENLEVEDCPPWPRWLGQKESGR